MQWLKSPYKTLQFAGVSKRVIYSAYQNKDVRASTV